MKSFYTLFFLLLILSSCNNNSVITKTPGILQLINCKIGTTYINISETATNIPIDNNIFIQFSSPIDTSTVRKNISIKKIDNTSVSYSLQLMDEGYTLVLIPTSNLESFTNYSLQIGAGIKGKQEEIFPGVNYLFTTVQGKMTVESIFLNNKDLAGTTPLLDQDRKNIKIDITFNQALNPDTYQSYITLLDGIPLTYSISADKKKISLTNKTALKGYTKYIINISGDLIAQNGYIFSSYSRYFYTTVDSTAKFPQITDDELLTLVQKQTFKYFYDYAHPNSGLARERNSSGDIVTIGGSGFGVMTLIVAMERGFITRTQGLAHISKILNFLESCDRFHGVWPHWLNGNTGKVNPFSPLDDGADLVETSFMTQGLITMRQYLNASVSTEKSIIDRINVLCDAVEYDWFTRSQSVLYWHWSPNTAWATNVKLQGYNETLITYVMAATSSTHSIAADAYKLGYTRNGAFKNGNSYYGIKLPLGEAYGGPLFFTHYSFLGLDPRKLKDNFADYWQQNVNHSLINWNYCVQNPKKYLAYSKDVWGLTASDNSKGYSAHSPSNDLGVISPTAAISAIPYTPKQSLDAIRFFYYVLGDKLWGQSGFYDAFEINKSWYANSFLAIDQGPIICMIENYRTGLLWNLFMSAPEVKTGLDKLGFTY